MNNVFMKNGKEIVLREAMKEDAKRIIDFYNIVGGETDFLSFGKNEFKRSLSDYENFLETTRTEENSKIVLAIDEDKLIGIVSINSNQKSRYKHVGTLGIVISERYCGQGLGKIMMEYIIEWSKNNGITKKIALVVNENNSRAFDLYKKTGFEVEGILKKDNYTNGVYYNSVMMGLIL